MAVKHLWKKYKVDISSKDRYVIKGENIDSSFDWYGGSGRFRTPFYGSGARKPSSVTVQDTYDNYQYCNIVSSSYIENNRLKHKLKDSSRYSFDSYNIENEWVKLKDDDSCAFYITKVDSSYSEAKTSKMRFLDKTIEKIKEKGDFLENVISENRNDFPDNNFVGDYWYVYQGLANNTPVISGEDANLGEKNKPFEIEYSVKDEDITDRVTIKEYLNNRLLRTIDNANNTNQTLKITSELLNSCPLGETNTIKIYAEDEKGAGTYRNYWFKRTNTPPYFVEENQDLGTIKKAPTVSFTAKDDDGDKYLKAKVKINQRIVKTYDQLGNGEQVSFTLDWKDFMQLNHSRKHNLWVEIEDSSGAIATLKYTFEREVNSIEIVTNTAPLDIKIKLIVFNANIKLGEGATFLQYACNDFGTGNTWEEIQNGVPYEFKNEHVGNDKIGYKCKLTKGTTESEIRSIGGSFI